MAQEWLSTLTAHILRLSKKFTGTYVGDAQVIIVHKY